MSDIYRNNIPPLLSTALEITKATRLKHQHLIIELCNYRNCEAGEQQELKTKARQAAVVCARSIYIFRELINYMEEQRIVVPSDSFMQDMVGKALEYEERRSMTLYAIICGILIEKR
ncbi:MAG: DUF4158 domain-containing protein [Thermodesulfovibrionales bacterium]|jgi:hypothetical protein